MTNPAEPTSRPAYLSRRNAALSAGAVVVLVAVAASPPLLGRRVSAALDALGGADQHWLAVGAVGFALSFLCTVASWHAAFAAAGARIAPRQAAARLWRTAGTTGCSGQSIFISSVASPEKLPEASIANLCRNAGWREASRRRPEGNAH